MGRISWIFGAHITHFALVRLYSWGYLRYFCADPRTRGRSASQWKHLINTAFILCTWFWRKLGTMLKTANGVYAVGSSWQWPRVLCIWRTKLSHVRLPLHISQKHAYTHSITPLVTRKYKLVDLHTDDSEIDTTFQRRLWILCSLQYRGPLTLHL